MRTRGTDEFEVMHTGAPLELRRTDTGARHYLFERPLAAGDQLELLLSDGAWLRGSYEWRGSEVSWPGFRFPIGGGITLVAPLHPDAQLRWPPR